MDTTSYFLFTAFKKKQDILQQQFKTSFKSKFEALYLNECSNK